MIADEVVGWKKKGEAKWTMVEWGDGEIAVISGAEVVMRQM